MHHFGAWKLAGKFVGRGSCEKSTTCSEGYRRLRYFVDVVSVGRSVSWRVSIWRRFRAETLHPLQSFDVSPFIGNWNIFLYWKMFFFSLSKGRYPFSLPLKGALSNATHPPYYLLSPTGEVLHYLLFHYSTNVLSTCGWHVILST